MARSKSREEWKIYGNVFDEFTNQLLFRLSTQGYFDRLKSAYRLGKEANVFIAQTKEGHEVLVKIYRLENCNFNKMHEYLIQDERYENLKGQRRKIIFSWVQREFRNLLLAREHIRVPTPIVFKDNVIIMELIGDANGPAAQLKDVGLENPAKMLDAIIAIVKKLYAGGLVHGDLSAFNILVQDDEAVFIDFSQGTTTKSPTAQELLRRDVVNLLAHFHRLGVERDVDEVLANIRGQGI